MCWSSVPFSECLPRMLATKLSTHVAPMSASLSSFMALGSSQHLHRGLGATSHLTSTSCWLMSAFWFYLCWTLSFTESRASKSRSRLFMSCLQTISEFGLKLSLWHLQFCVEWSLELVDGMGQLTHSSLRSALEQLYREAEEYTLWFNPWEHRHATRSLPCRHWVARIVSRHHVPLTLAWGLEEDEVNKDTLLLWNLVTGVSAVLGHWWYLWETAQNISFFHALRSSELTSGIRDSWALHSLLRMWKLT